MSGSVDYFKVNADLSGYRKKVTPRFDGTFEISQHISEFTLSIKDNHLWIIYTNNNVTYSEEIVRANKKFNPLQLRWIYIYLQTLRTFNF